MTAMGGKRAHCGFPEQSLESYAQRFLDIGYMVSQAGQGAGRPAQKRRVSTPRLIWFDPRTCVPLDCPFRAGMRGGSGAARGSTRRRIALQGSGQQRASGRAGADASLHSQHGHLRRHDERRQAAGQISAGHHGETDQSGGVGRGGRRDSSSSSSVLSSSSSSSSQLRGPRIEAHEHVPKHE